MAIYHCSASNISRSSGRTATASAAYRAGEKIKDERTGILHDFTKKQGVEHTEIVSSLGISIDRAQLWNLAEQAESRKDARTAKEYVIALPNELNPQQRQELALDFAQHLVNRYGCIADVAIHAPSQQGDNRNHHAHIMTTTRKAALNEHKQLVLTDKIDLELSNAKRKQLGLGSTTQEITAIRQAWEQLANQHLEQAGRSERIDHRSHQEAGNGKIAQIHETPQVTALRRKGQETEISRTNDQRRAYNQQIDQENAQEKHKNQENILANAQERLQQRLNERQQTKQTEQEKIQQKQHRNIGIER